MSQSGKGARTHHKVEKEANQSGNDANDRTHDPTHKIVRAQLSVAGMALRAINANMVLAPQRVLPQVVVQTLKDKLVVALCASAPLPVRFTSAEREQIKN